MNKKSHLVALLLFAASEEMAWPEVPGWLSPPSDVPSSWLVSGNDDSPEIGVLSLPEFPPKLKPQAVSMPKERMETNKVFLFIFVFRGYLKPLLFLSEWARSTKRKFIKSHA